jgi:hypothetical protein
VIVNRSGKYQYELTRYLPLKASKQTSRLPLPSSEYNRPVNNAQAIAMSIISIHFVILKYFFPSERNQDSLEKWPDLE